MSLVWIAKKSMSDPLLLTGELLSNVWIDLVICFFYIKLQLTSSCARSLQWEETSGKAGNSL